MTFAKAESIAKVSAWIIVGVVIIASLVLFAPLIESAIGAENPVPVTAPIQTVTQNTARVTTNGLNIRTQPSAGSSIVKTIRRGNILSITGESRDGWLPVEHNGDRGWVNAKYINLSAWPKDGTYTFEPRLKTRKGDSDIEQWLAKIVAQNGNLDLYLTSSSAGKGARSGLSFGPPSTLILDTGSENYKAAKAPVWDEKTGAYIITFQNVASTQFSYCETEPSPDLFITNIRLVNPD
ncbi:MAG: SH3 domain-containing protein [Spirochaetaceae bacterium]|jgi:hypothetical protein|nr:SH3 domain-containing protein [Spirochaetaceae bacterium]